MNRPVGKGARLAGVILRDYAVSGFQQVIDVAPSIACFGECVRTFVDI